MSSRFLGTLVPLGPLVPLVLRALVAGLMAEACVAMVGCHRDPRADLRESPTSHDPRDPLEGVARKLGVDAGPLQPEPTPPPSPPGDLASDVLHFTSLAACVEEHATKDPLVSDALGALGYDTFLGDVCRTLEAAHTKSLLPCGRIDASGLRRECETLFAVSSGQPEACPLPVADAPWLGRDPTCLALTTGDARLCAAETDDRRGRCDALTERSEARCPTKTENARAACLRDVARWRGLAATKPERRPPFTIKARLTLDQADAGKTDAALAVDLTSLARHGVVLVREGPGAFVGRFGQARELGGAPLASSPEMGPRVAFTLAIPSTGPAVVPHLEVDLPGRAPLVAPPLHFEGGVVVTGAKERGAPVTMRLAGTITQAPRVYAVEIEVETFIHDVIDNGHTTSHEPP